MRKSILLAILILVLVLFIGVSTASAQLRFDVGLNVPVYFGIDIEGFSGGTFAEFTFVFPEVSLHYMLEAGPLKLGIGVEALTFILESLIFPTFLVELDLDPIVISSYVGGGAFLFFGLYNAFHFANIYMLDVKVGFKINDWFRIGAGGFNFLDLIDVGDETIQVYAFVGYLFARFTFTF